MHDAFQAHFRDRFARCPELPLQELRSYLAGFTRLGAAEATSCECVVTECEVCDALKQVVLNKSPGLDGLPYMFVPILTDMFNNLFALGAIPVALPMVWSHCWRKVAGMFGRVQTIPGP